MNKITVNLLGGLGNQLHCYAFGYALSQKLNVQFEVDCASSYWNDIYEREYLLDHFENIQVNKKKLPKTNIGRLLVKVSSKFHSYISTFLPIKYKLAVFEGGAKHIQFRSDIFNIKFMFNPTFTGYWASYRYLIGVENDLREILKPPAPKLPEALSILNKISNVNSCFIHYRSYSEQDETLAIHTQYYREAVSKMVKEVPDVKFFVFSDDCDRAKFQLKSLGSELHFIDIKEANGNQQSLIDFYLMYRCRHAIIANSTFSWWAAWLNDNEEKIVICPDGVSPWGSDWADSEWLKIKVS